MVGPALLASDDGSEAVGDGPRPDYLDFMAAVSEAIEGRFRNATLYGQVVGTRAVGPPTSVITVQLSVRGS